MVEIINRKNITGMENMEMESGVIGNIVIKVGDSSALKISSIVNDKGDQFSSDIEDSREPTEIIPIHEHDVVTKNGNGKQKRIWKKRNRRTIQTKEKGEWMITRKITLLETEMEVSDQEKLKKDRVDLMEFSSTTISNLNELCYHELIFKNKVEAGFHPHHE